MTAPVHRLKALGGLSIYQTGTDTAVTSIRRPRLALLAFLARGTFGVRRKLSRRLRRTATRIARETR